MHVKTEVVIAKKIVARPIKCQDANTRAILGGIYSQIVEPFVDFTGLSNRCSENKKIHDILEISKKYSVFGCFDMKQFDTGLTQKYLSLQNIILEALLGPVWDLWEYITC